MAASLGPQGWGDFLHPLAIQEQLNCPKPSSNSFQPSCEVAQAQPPQQPPQRTKQKVLILTGLLSTALMLLPAHSFPPWLQPLLAASSDGVCLSSRGFALVEDAGMTTQSQNNSVNLQKRYYIQQQDKVFCLTNMTKADEDPLFPQTLCSVHSHVPLCRQTTTRQLNVNFDVALIRCRAVLEEAKDFN